LTAVTIADLTPQVDAEQATRHLQQLHRGAEGYLSLVLLAAPHREQHCFTAVNDLIPVKNFTTIVESREALTDIVNARWNVYTACSTFATVPEKGRGTRTNVSSVPGVWCDLDVKPGTEGYFQTEEELLAFTGRLLTPTLEIATGSGGRHLYWLTKERVPTDGGQKLLHAWLDYLRTEADGVVIENVHDTTRILRLAGTVRWPKVDDGQEIRPMSVVLCKDDGPRYHKSELELLSSMAHNEAKARRDDMMQQRSSLDKERRESLLSCGLDLQIYDHVVRRFNLLEDWANLLESTGWTLFSDQRDGPARCRFWTRPGKSREDGKSASTDYTNDDGFVSSVMTIYSGDSQLDDLRENATGSDAHGLCTKYHYAISRLYENDESVILRAIALGGGRLP
jgi:hypothetical protein